MDFVRFRLFAVRSFKANVVGLPLSLFNPCFFRFWCSSRVGFSVKKLSQKMFQSKATVPLGML